MYLSLKTRPDITFAKPTIQHWKAVKRIMRYLNGTHNFGILHSNNGISEITGYSDADWGGDTDDPKSTSGYCFVVSWSSKKQSCVALSTAETDYIVLANARSCLVAEANRRFEI